MTPVATQLRRKNYALLTISVFCVFLVYYLWTSSALPHGAGPDYRSNTAAAAFIFDHHRLAVFPGDEDKAYFTVYGGTRSARPPLSYIVSAAVATLYPTATDVERFSAFRKGSSLLVAAAVAVCFLGLYVLLDNLLLAILGAALFGLLPQLTFIASYTNDDSGAIFSATLLFSLLVLTHRKGVSILNAALLGLAGGLVILSKFSAWLVLPFALGYATFLMLSTTDRELWSRYGVLALVMGMIGGGWWIAFNVANYGFNDPFALNIQMELAQKHHQLDSTNLGYGSRGVGFKALVIDNHDNFMGKTFQSTIGNLDWLRLPMGWLQYGLYLAVLGVAIGYYLLRMARCIVVSIRSWEWAAFDRQFLFETALFGAIVLQLVMYAWTNIHNDIQIQGKYLLPVLMAALLLFFFALSTAATWIRQHWLDGRTEILLSTNTLAAIAPSCSLGLVLLMHVEGLFNRVIPFYVQPLYNLKLGNFTPVELSRLVPDAVNNLEVRHQPDRIELEPAGKDPWVVWSGGICSLIKRNTALRLTIESERGDTFQIFIDEGKGFREDQSVKADYRSGQNDLIIAVAVDDCKRVRFDPTRGAAPPLSISGLGVSTVDIRPRL